MEEQSFIWTINIKISLSYMNISDYVNHWFKTETLEYISQKHLVYKKMYLFAYPTPLTLSNFFIYYTIFLSIVLRIELEALGTPGKHHGVFIKCGMLFAVLRSVSYLDYTQNVLLPISNFSFFKMEW